MAGLIRRIPSGEVVPGCARAKDPQHRIQHRAGICPGPPPPIGAAARTKARFEHGPLGVGEIHAAWYDGDRWCDIHGKPPEGTPTPVSFCDERFWQHFSPLLTKLAERFRGEDVYFSPFLGVHAELKWSDWWSYDASTLAKWREVIKTRPAWLIDVAGDAQLPDKPPIPLPTDGTA